MTAAIGYLLVVANANTEVRTQGQMAIMSLFVFGFSFLFIHGFILWLKGVLAVGCKAPKGVQGYKCALVP